MKSNVIVCGFDKYFSENCKCGERIKEFYNIVGYCDRDERFEEIYGTNYIRSLELSERVVFFCMDYYAVQTIIIEDSVVDLLSCSALVIDFLEGLRATSNLRIKLDILFGLGFYASAIFGRIVAVLAF